jgi:uncharacterized transporter YbjL
LWKTRWAQTLESPTVAHLRPPSFSQGFVSFLWGFFLGLYIWLGSVAVGVSGGTAFIIGAVAGFLIFLYVRFYGTQEPVGTSKR